MIEVVENQRRLPIIDKLIITGETPTEATDATSTAVVARVATSTTTRIVVVHHLRMILVTTMIVVAGAPKIEVDNTTVTIMIQWLSSNIIIMVCHLVEVHQIMLRATKVETVHLDQE